MWRTWAWWTWRTKICFFSTLCSNYFEICEFASDTYSYRSGEHEKIMQYKISNKKNYSVTDIFLVHSFANDPQMSRNLYYEVPGAVQLVCIEQFAWFWALCRLAWAVFWYYGLFVFLRICSMLCIGHWTIQHFRRTMWNVLFNPLYK